MQGVSGRAVAFALEGARQRGIDPQSLLDRHRSHLLLKPLLGKRAVRVEHRGDDLDLGVGIEADRSLEED